LDDESETGYTLVVDLEYPERLHDFFADYPPGADSVTIKQEWLSRFQQNLQLDRECLSNDRKLAPNLFNKENYVVDYRNLKYYVELGVVVTKIHRVIQFNQSDWMRDYIRMNV